MSNDSTLQSTVVEALVLRAAAGDPQAREQLIDRYTPVVQMVVKARFRNAGISPARLAEDDLELLG